MFDFIRKEQLWSALDAGCLDEIGKRSSYELKVVQDVVVYSLLRNSRGLAIAEIGGGESRLLRRLSEANQCYNIEKFEGAHGGPKTEVTLPNVQNLKAYVGEWDLALKDDFFDVAFSISVVEHVDTAKLDSFHNDLLRILKTGGAFIHAIDMYLQDEPTGYWHQRFAAYKSWVTNDHHVLPIGHVYGGPLAFSCDMATNPDNILRGWNSLVPELARLRERAQSVCLLVAGRKQPRTENS